MVIQSITGKSSSPTTSNQASSTSYSKVIQPLTTSPTNNNIKQVQAPSGGFKVGDVIPNIEKAVSNVATTIKNTINPPVKLPSGLTLNYVSPSSNIVSSTTPANKTLNFEAPLPQITDFKPGQTKLTPDQLNMVQPNFATPNEAPSAKQPINKQTLQAQQQMLNQIQEVSNKFTTSFPQTAGILHSIGTDPLNLKADPSKIINDFWNAIKEPVLQEFQNIKNSNNPKQTVLERNINSLKNWTGAAGVLFAPISALFSAGNDLPGIGSLTKIITLPFAASGEGATQVSNKIIDQLPISKQAKAIIKPGLGEVASLVAQLAVGVGIGMATKERLTAKFGTEDAQTIINQAQDIAKTANRDLIQRVITGNGSPEDLRQYNILSKAGIVGDVARKPGSTQIAGLLTSGEHTPEDLTSIVVNNKLENTPEGKMVLKAAVDAKTNGQNIHVGELPSDLTNGNPIAVKSTDELLTYIDRQGNRTPEQISALKADIIKNGIKYPIELIDKQDGTFEINDGTHRIQIANDLGIKQLPVKVVGVKEIQTIRDIKTPDDHIVNPIIDEISAIINQNDNNEASINNRRNQISTTQNEGSQITSSEITQNSQRSISPSSNTSEGTKNNTISVGQGGNVRSESSTAKPTEVVGSGNTRNESVKPSSEPANSSIGNGEALKVSKIAKEIEAKAVEKKLTEGFSQLAGYSPTTVKEQAQINSDIINNGIDGVRQILRGEVPLPERANPAYFIKAMEAYLDKNPDPEVLMELAKSNVVSQTSEAAQTLRMAAERDPYSPLSLIKKLEDSKKAVIEKQGTISSKVDKEVKSIKASVKKELPNKDRWLEFIREIECGGA